MFIPVIKINWNKYVDGLYKRDFNSYKNKFENKLDLIFIYFINLLFACKHYSNHYNSLKLFLNYH